MEQWNKQVAQSINKAKKYLHAIRLIKKYFNPNELKQLITSNFYSILYYNCEIWLIPWLSPLLKQQLLAASSSALRLSGKSDWTTSNDRITQFTKEQNDDL